MSWLTLAGKTLNLGEDIGTALQNVMKAVIKTGLNDGSWEHVLDVADSELGTLLDAAELKLAQTILESFRDFLAKYGQEEFGDLVVKLSDLERRTTLDFGQDGRINFGKFDWSGGKTVDAGKLPLTLKLETGLSLYFEVLEEKITRAFPLPAGRPSQAFATLVLDGMLAAKADANLKNTRLALGLNANASAGRTLKLHMSYPSQDRYAGLGLADALKRVPVPYDLASVGAALSKEGPFEGKLDAVEYTGKSGLGAGADIKLTVLTAAGPIPITLAGRAQLGNDFQLVTFKDSPGDSSVRLIIKTGSEREFSGSLGISYQIGLGDIAPDEAAKLLKALVKSEELIASIDKKIADDLDFSSWLKPGTALQKEIKKLLNELLSTSANESDEGKKAAEISIPEFVALLGLSSDQTRKKQIDQITESASSLFAGLVDDLFEPLGDQAGLVERMSDALKSAFSDKVVGAVKERVLEKIPDLGSKLDAAATKLDVNIVAELSKALERTGVTDKITLFREYLSKARGLLKTTIEKVELASTNLLTAEILVTRTTSETEAIAMGLILDPGEREAQSTYRQLVTNPRSATRLFTQKIPGVVIDEKMDFLRTREIITKAGVSWRLALIDATMSGQSSVIARTKIIEDGKTGILKAETELKAIEQTKVFGETRTTTLISSHKLWYARAIDHGSTHSEPLPKAAPEFSVAFVQDDKALQVKEARKILSAFVEEQLVSGESFAALINKLMELKAVNPGKKLKSEIGVSLAIPPGDIPRLFAAGVASETKLIKMGRAAVAVNLADKLNEFYDDLAKVTYKSETRSAVIDALGLSERYYNGPEIDDEFVLERMSDIVKRAKRKASTTPMKTKLQNLGSDLEDATRAVSEYMRLGHEILTQFDENTTPVQLNQRQEEMRAKLKPLLRPGYAKPDWLPDWIFEERAPKRLVVLFSVLSDFCSSQLGYRPPVILTLQPEGGLNHQFVSGSERS